MKSIAVVGNGPADSFSAHAAERIDACDLVFRFNNYALDGHQRLVGTKTTHWGTSFLRDIQDRPPGSVWVTLPLLDERWYRRHARHYGYVEHMPQLERLARWLVDEARDVRIIPWRIYERAGRISAGLLLLYWLYVERGWSLDGVVVEGFGFFAPDRPHHYFENRPSDGRHDHVAEIEFYKAMKAGAMR
jgi:hypothetical protein